MTTPKKNRGWGAFSLVAPLLAALGGCTVTTNGDDTTDHCGTDATVSCPSPSLGYSCTGAVRPQDGDASLSCGSGIESAGVTTYCCSTTTGVAQNTCGTDPTITSCGSAATPYTCSGSVTPVSLDPSLNCGSGVPGPNGTLSYCCSTTTAVATDCTVDATLTSCGTTSTGYRCEGGIIPTDTDPTLVCGDGVDAGGGAEAFCCFQFTSTTCSPDPDVTGCTDDSYGFSCTSTATPTDENSALLCSDPLPGQNGKTLYCCSQ